MGSRHTVYIDGLSIGGVSPVRVESMLKTPLRELDACIEEANLLANEGCELVRVSFPEVSLASNFTKLISSTKIKIMADIHFNHKLALCALECGCKSIRINPGNMSSDKNGLRDVVRLASSLSAVIRIGANGGSLSNTQIKESKGNRSAALVSAVEEQIRLLLDEGFYNMIISAKSSCVTETLRANVALSEKYEFPLHIGITEAGGGTSGIVKGALGIGMMLAQGIGDTIRVSLTAPGVEEVKTGYHILRALEIRQKGYNLISCPTCGRKRIDVAKFAALVEKSLPRDIPDGLSIAVMGCEVNGPREASEADLGIAGTPTGFVLFKKGEHISSAPLEELPAELAKALRNL